MRPTLLQLVHYLKVVTKLLNITSPSQLLQIICSICNNVVPGQTKSKIKCLSPRDFAGIGAIIHKIGSFPGWSLLTP